MSRRLVYGGLLAVLCVVAIVVGGAMLSDALAPSPTEEVLEQQEDFSENELDRLGSDGDPIGYGGEPGSVTSESDIRVRYGAVAEPYWRTTSYDSYNGSAWYSTGATHAYDGTRETPSSGGKVSYDIESWAKSTAVPSHWQPVWVDENRADSVLVREDGSFEYAAGFSPGETYSVTSERPDWRYDELETAATDTSAVDDAYTDLPAGLPDRLESKADEITADAETPYQAAVLLERWLLTEKEYALDASAETDWLVDEFVFEREEGTSEFFASAMTTMLRTQDIPARYVTGFAPAAETADGDQVVRGKHAHAWVEVYFEDVGWVSFDPTPPDRLLERNEPLGTTSAPMTGPSTELETSASEAAFQSTFDATPAGAQLASWELPDERPVIDIFDEDGTPVDRPTPGTSIVVAVSNDTGDPLEGHRVLFDGESVGVTDENGAVQATVPYTDEVTITVQEPAELDDPENGEQDDGETEPAESGLGALNPTDETGVGGEIGTDPETFGNTDAQRHLRVESSESAYWRTDAYDEFTGSGWQQTGATTEYEEPLSTPDNERNTVEFEITLEQSALALPVVWEPESLDGIDEDLLEVTDQGGIRSTEVLEAGTAYEGVAYLPPDDVSLLRDAGDEYPTEIAERYTQLPEGTPERVAEHASELTESDPTAYDAAMSIQEWLRTEKDYSLEATATGQHIDDEFIFEMEAGYCEYFATAMVSMLRTQGIPARYTIGYAPGEEVGDGIYDVHGIQAHAWVEVYFPEVGWVTFDPTPGDDRLQSEQDVLGDDESDPEFPGEGSPGETFEPDDIDRPGDVIVDESDFETGGYTDHTEVTDAVSVGETPDPLLDQVRFVASESTTDGGTLAETVTLAADSSPRPVESNALVETVTSEDFNLTLDVESDIEITVGETNTPGESLDVEATIRDTPVPDAAVDVRTEDGTEVLETATTDDEGMATITLPPYETVQIVVERDEASGERLHDIALDLELSVDDETAVPGGSTDVEVTSGGEPVPDVLVRPGDERTDAEGATTVPVPYAEEVDIVAEVGDTTLEQTLQFAPELEITGVPEPGDSLEVTVHTDDDPIPGVAVRPGDNRTSEDGSATVMVPYEESLTVVAERDDIRLDETFELEPEFDVSVDGLALPGTSLNVEVTQDGDPVENASIEFAGRDVATTDGSGEATFSVPLRPTFDGTVTATRGEFVTTSSTLLGPLWLALGGVLGGIVAMSTWHLRRRTEGGESLGLTLAIRISKYVHGFVERVRVMMGGLIGGTAIVGLARRVKNWLRAIVTSPLEVLRGFVLFGLLTSVVVWLRERLGRSSDDISLDGTSVSAETHEAPTRATTDTSDPETVAERTVVDRAWLSLAESVGAAPSDTPSEVAEQAVERGLPSEPVTRITRIYRAYRFGGEVPDGDVEQELKDALSSLEGESKQ